MSLSGFYNFLYSRKNAFRGAVKDVAGLLSFKIYTPLILLVNIGTWSGVYFITDKMSEELAVLHYNVDFGVDKIGNASELYIMPAVGLAVFLVNSMLLFFLHRHRDIKFLSHFLWGTSLATNAIILIALGPVYLINFVY